MFWTLGLAHLIGDYPLQTDGMVRAKRYWWGLTLHVGIHFAVMLLLSGRVSFVIWPQLLALTAIHFVIDTFKNYQVARWPRLVFGPYVLDQVLHILSIIAVASWIESAHGIYRDQNWHIYAAAYLSVTHVWFITERVAAHGKAQYQAEVKAHRWSRLLARAVALSVYLVLGRLLLAPEALIAAGLLTTLIPAPYRCAAYRRSMLIQDLLGPLLVALLVFVFIH